MAGLAEHDLTDEPEDPESGAAPDPARVISARAGLVACLCAVKVLGAISVLVWMPFSNQVSGSKVPSVFIVLQLIAYGGAGSALLFAHARDRRTANLGTALLCVASAFSTAHFRILGNAVSLLSWLSNA